ncbi:MAG TPA: membrane-bound lytic murein transglycosylase MltF [Porticoccaceae bacterium]|nr:membrane-bound lytic murein transglycosylase MltF [Porticoccaceae bacterium]
MWQSPLKKAKSPWGFMRQLSKKVRKMRNRVMLLLLALCLVLYLPSSNQLSDLERIQNRGSITMLTTPGPTTFYEDGRGQNGFEYILAKAFADSLNVELKINTKNSLRGLLLSIGGPQGDFAASNIVKTPLRSESLVFSDAYLDVTQQLIYGRGKKKPRSIDQISGNLVVIMGSSHSERLWQLKMEKPFLRWREQDDLEMFELMEMVHRGDIDYAIVDSIAYLVSRHIYPSAALAFDISTAQSMAWAFPRHGDGTLVAAANQFLHTFKNSGKLAKLKRELLNHSDRFSVADSKQLGELVTKRLPDYESMFRRTAQKYALDWQLLAAIAYQESHWNPRAKSPTGVRGLMMLTLGTAREMGVSNRLNTQQSLDGGAAYLIKLRNRLPKRITEPDRTLLALAAYNVGFGHLEDARILTQKGGNNPDLWSDVSQYLPKLSNKKFYVTSKYGYARGAEPVLYVANIQYYRHYLQLLSRSQQKLDGINQENSVNKNAWEHNSMPTI